VRDGRREQNDVQKNPQRGAERPVQDRNSQAVDEDVSEDGRRAGAGEHERDEPDQALGHGMPDDPEEHEARGEPPAQGKKLQAWQGRVMEVRLANLAELAHDVNHKRQQPRPETGPRRDPQLGRPGRAGDYPGEREDLHMIICRMTHCTVVAMTGAMSGLSFRRQMVSR
jgi:hypothetical protein